MRLHSPLTPGDIDDVVRCCPAPQQPPPRDPGQDLHRPAGHNSEWPGVLALLEVVGAVSQHDGRFLVTVGSETESLEKPRNKDIDAQQVVDLRRMLGNAGYGPQE